MPLTTNQLNAHLRTIVIASFSPQALNVLTDETRTALLYLVRACIFYARGGGVDEKEAARTIARSLIERLTGHAITAPELHYLQNHLAGDAVPGSVGEL